MSDKTKIGAEVDGDVWQAFRKFCEDRHGRVRGTLGEEVERALEDRMQAANGPDQLDRIEDDLASLKAMVAEADGGVDVQPADLPLDLSPAEPHTHTAAAEEPAGDADGVDGQDGPVPVPDEQPHHRASSRRSRAAWLHGWVIDEVGQDGMMSLPAIATRAAKVWGYDRHGDLVDDLAEQTIDLLDRRFDVEDHPSEADTYVWGDTADDVWDQHEQQVRQEVEAKGEDLYATPGSDDD